MLSSASIELSRAYPMLGKVTTTMLIDCAIECLLDAIRNGRGLPNVSVDTSLSPLSKE